MSTIVCRGLSFGYDGSGRNVFTDLDLVIDTRWRSALVGRNGRGKTTLLRLIHGELTPDRGSIDCAVVTRHFPYMPSDPAISAFDVARDAAGPFRRWEAEMAGLLDAGGDTASLERFGALQARFQEAGGYEIEAQVSRELGALDIGTALRHRPFRDLSGGERTRCLLAGLFARDEGFVLIDEPTNHLDRAGRARLAAYLDTKSGFLLVSHDRAFLDACIDHVIALNRDTVETQRTTFSVWREHFRRRLAAQESRNAELRKDIARLEASARHRRAGAMKRESDKTSHFAEPVDLLILDEPLNFIDIHARESIEDAVLRDAPTLVFVEHDAAFVERVATRRIDLVPSNSSARGLEAAVGSST